MASEQKTAWDVEYARLERVTAQILFPDIFKKRTKRDLFKDEDEAFEAEERKAIVTE